MKMALTLTDREVEETVERLAKKIADYAADAKAKGAVVAFSGGLDSAVVLALAAKSGVNVKALILPEEGVNRKEDRLDSEAFAEKLGVSYEVIHINKIVYAVDKTFPWEVFSGGKEKLAKANIKPRARMLLNYIAANLDDRIVLGTGNKTELALGYFTKYGDGGVDVLPIGSLYKTQVRQIARKLNVPGKIIEKTPSAGLWEGQTDEEELNTTYEKADKILYALIDEGKDMDGICEETGVERSAVAAIVKRVERNRHKCESPPIL